VEAPGAEATAVPQSAEPVEAEGRAALEGRIRGFYLGLAAIWRGDSPPDGDPGADRPERGRTVRVAPDPAAMDQRA
jgi:hypothetical protein